MDSITQNSKNTKRYLPHDLKTKENAVKTYLNLGRFDSLGVVETKDCPNTNELIAFLSKLKRIFDKDIFTKEDIVSCIKDYLPNFNHEEKGKNLDQKM